MPLLQTLNSLLELLKEELESDQAGALGVAYAMAFDVKTVLNMYACTETNRRLNCVEETEMKALALSQFHAIVDDIVHFGERLQQSHPASLVAEKAAWNFVKERKPHFDFTVLCHPMVFGPPAHAVSFSAPNLSAWDMNRFLSGGLEDVPNTDFWGFVDVRDLTKAHIHALEVPEAGNERLFHCWWAI